MENLKINKIKVLRLDNEGEYISNDFKDFWKEVGMKREKIASYKPQHNGLAERKNKSIINTAKAKIHDQGMLMFFWVEECNIKVYFFHVPN